MSRIYNGGVAPCISNRTTAPPAHHARSFHFGSTLCSDQHGTYAPQQSLPVVLRSKLLLPHTLLAHHFLAFRYPGSDSTTRYHRSQIDERVVNESRTGLAY
jgi:hypothetical protein